MSSIGQNGRSRICSLKKMRERASSTTKKMTVATAISRIVKGSNSPHATNRSPVNAAPFIEARAVGRWRPVKWRGRARRVSDQPARARGHMWRRLSAPDLAACRQEKSPGRLLGVHFFRGRGSRTEEALRTSEGLATEPATYCY